MDWETLLAQLPVLTAIVQVASDYASAAALMRSSKRLLSTGAGSSDIRVAMWYLRTAPADWGDCDDPADKTPLQRYTMALEAAARHGDLRAVRHMAETSPDTLRLLRPQCSCLPPTGIAIAANAAHMAIAGDHVAVLQYLANAVLDTHQIEMAMKAAIYYNKTSSVDILLNVGATFGQELAKYALNFTENVAIIVHLCARDPEAFRGLLCYAVETCHCLQVVQLLCEGIGCKTTTREVQAAHHVDRQDLADYLQNRMIIETTPYFRGMGRHYPPRRR